MNIPAPAVPSLDSLFAPAGLAARMPLAVIAWDHKARILGWNAAASQLFGWSAEEAGKMSVVELVHPERRGIKPGLMDLLASGALPAHGINENMTRYGRIVTCEWHNTLFRDSTGNVVAAISMARDITQQRRVERERERLRGIAVAANAAHDPDEILLLVRNAVMELGRFDRVGVWWHDNGTLYGAWGTDEDGLIRDEHHRSFRFEELKPAHHQILDKNVPYSLAEYSSVYLPGKGEVSLPEPRIFCAIPLRVSNELIGIIFIDNLLSGSLISEEDIIALLPFTQQVAVAVANARLLTERQHMLERQRRLMEMAAAINASLELDEVLLLLRNTVVEVAGFDRAGVFLVDRGTVYGSWGTDEQGQLKDEHHSVHSLSYWVKVGPELIAGKRNYYLEYQDHLINGMELRSVCHVVVALHTGGELVGLLTVDNLISGNPVTEATILPLLPFAEQAAVAIRNARLLAELHQAQEALVRAERLRAIGELTGGVAHNINNILTAVLGCAELIQDEGDASPTIQEYAGIIVRAAMEGSDIVRQMQQFAHQEPHTNKARFDLAATVKEAVDITRPAWQNQAMARGTLIQVKCDMAADLSVFGVASEIREVIVNLITNATEAMPDGGTITIRCHPYATDAVVVVSDTGIGMDEPTRRRVFEPFFTTKGVELGTGMGLSVAWGIIERHHGHIEVESLPGKGTFFTVRLPLAAPQKPLASAAPNAQPLTGMHVLLVEDEEIIAVGLVRMLALHGAEATHASNAQQALEWLAVHHSECDVVVSDHGMVGMTGMELLALLRERYPNIRRILLSGWGLDLPNHNDTSAAEQLLVKPIRMNDLVEAIAAMS